MSSWKHRLEVLTYPALLLAALLACKGGNRGGSGSAESGAAEAAPEKPVAAVTAVDLAAAYHANEVAADEKYKDKYIGVAGMVTSISKDAFDNMVVGLDTKVPFQEVHATMKDSEKSKVATLSKGQAASLLCRGGGMIIGSPILRDCTVFQTAATPASSKK